MPPIADYRFGRLVLILGYIVIFIIFATYDGSAQQLAGWLLFLWPLLFSFLLFILLVLKRRVFAVERVQTMEELCLIAIACLYGAFSFYSYWFNYYFRRTLRTMDDLAQDLAERTVGSSV